MAAITDYTAARIVQGIATLYGSNAPMSQLVNPANVVQVDSVNRAGTVIKDFMPLVDGTVTALTTNTAETASGSQGVVPVSFTMYEYGKGADSVKFPWANFIARAEAPNAYVQVVESLANKAISALDLIATAFVRDAIGAGTDAAYTHPLGPNDLGAGVMGFTAPVTSKLVRYGTQSTSRATRSAITTADVATWDWVSSMVSTMVARNVRPLAVIGGKRIFGLVAHRHLIADLLKSLSSTSVYDNLLLSSGIAMDLANYGIGSSLVGLYDGVLLIESNRMKYASAGFGSIDVYPMAMVGGDFLAKAALAPSAMPATPPDGDMIPVGDGACVIVSPDWTNVHYNRLGVASWYAYAGFGVYDPYSYIRIECASTSAGRI